MHRLRRRLLAFGLLLGPFSSAGFAQHRTDPRQMYERIWVVVPMAGSGRSSDDPIRPMYAPAQRSAFVAQRQQQTPPGIIGFAYQVSDDGKFALCQFVARDRQAFAAILADKRPDVRVFERGKSSKPEIEAVFRQYKRDFDLSTLGVPIR